MRILAIFFLAGLAACARGKATTSRGRVVVDSLPDGTPRTITQVATGWVDTSGWKLVEETRLVGGAEGPGDLINPQSVSVDATGRVYVVDQRPAVIKQYSPDGHYLRSIGREGAGPGEFTVGFLAIAGANLYLHDPGQSRTSVFDTAGAFIRSWPSFCCFWTDIEIDSAGNVGIPWMLPPTGQSGGHNRFSRIVRWYRPDSAATDSTLIPSGPEVKYWTVRVGKQLQMMTSIPWMPNFEFAFLPDHHVVSGFSDHYLLAVTKNNGADTLAIFGRAWTPASISDAVRSAEVEKLISGSKGNQDEKIFRRSFPLADVPATAPAYDWIGHDGQGDIWLRTPVPGDSGRTLFDVFDPHHRWLGQVSGSKYLGLWRAHFVGDRMIAQGEDDEGNPVVVVYRIQR